MCTPVLFKREPEQLASDATTPSVWLCLINKKMVDTRRGIQDYGLKLYLFYTSKSEAKYFCHNQAPLTEMFAHALQLRPTLFLGLYHLHPLLLSESARYRSTPFLFIHRPYELQRLDLENISADGVMRYLH